MSLSFGPLFMGILFGLIGFAAFVWGKKTQSVRHMLLGIVLIGYSYFIDQLWLGILIGAGLTGLLFWP